MKTSENRGGGKCKCNMDMTIREFAEACGFDPEAVEKFLETCCKK